MLGDIKERKDFNTKTRKMQKTHENTFFSSRFGRNDFESIDIHEVKKGKTLNYILKYIVKAGESVFYSRGIQTHLDAYLKNEDLAVKLKEFITKYVLFDDVIYDEEMANNEEEYDIEKEDFRFPSLS